MPEIITIHQHIAWSYANLARAHAALESGCLKYSTVHHVIRARLYKGLVDGRMSLGSLYEDERLKMVLPQLCAYCGSSEKLSLDHLIPRSKAGPDDANNLVWACRSCNGSKQGRDMLRWMSARKTFPSLFVLRRYTKIVAGHCADQDLLDKPMSDIPHFALPFDLALLPHTFPPLTELVLWVAGGAGPKPVR